MAAMSEQRIDADVDEDSSSEDDIDEDATSEDDPRSKEDEDSLKCAVCLEVYKDPQLLPCLHSFCRNCLKSSTSCPLCREQYVLSNLVPNTLLASKVEQTTLKLEDQIKKCTQCDSSGDDVVIFCTECNGYLCQECEVAHKKLNIFKSHTSLLPLNQCCKFKKQFKCNKHTNELLSVYCIQCEVVVCKDCGLYSHQGHQFKPAPEAATDIKEKLVFDVASLGEKLEEFKGHCRTLDNVEKHVTTYPDKLKGFITKEFEELSQKVNERKETLLKLVDTQYDAFSKILWAEKNTVDTTVSHLKAAIKFGNELTSQSDDTLEVSVLGSQACASTKALKVATWSDKHIKAEGLLVYLPCNKKCEDELVNVETIGDLVNIQSTTAKLKIYTFKSAKYCKSSSEWPSKFTRLSDHSVKQLGFIKNGFVCVRAQKVMTINKVNVAFPTDVNVIATVFLMKLAEENQVVPCTLTKSADGLTVTFSTAIVGEYRIYIGVCEGVIISSSIVYTSIDFQY